MVRHFLTTAAAITSSAVTDAEFEKLDSEFQRLLRSRRRIPADMRRKLAACRGCGRDDSEFYMLPRSLWLTAVPTGRGCLCLACLAKRLGRPLTRNDFSDPDLHDPQTPKERVDHLCFVTMRGD